MGTTCAVAVYLLPFVFCQGMELYPCIGKSFDIEVFTNCRFGMMSWAVLAITYCIKQFFWWEAGYLNTMDIAHERGMYLVNHPVNLGSQLALYILVAGILCIYINYDCDRQRQEFRRTSGKCKIWGKAPSKIEATYTTTSGETKTSLLLTSGCRGGCIGSSQQIDIIPLFITREYIFSFGLDLGNQYSINLDHDSCRWGLARHFHYVPEILAAFFWTVPALFNHFLPYFYVVFSYHPLIRLSQKG
ncbi:hypothetical protein V6N13_023442 [Hibiscus sabdariffa]